MQPQPSSQLGTAQLGLAQLGQFENPTGGGGGGVALLVLATDLTAGFSGPDLSGGFEG